MVGFNGILSKKLNEKKKKERKGRREGRREAREREKKEKDSGERRGNNYLDLKKKGRHLNHLSLRKRLWEMNFFSHLARYQLEATFLL